MTSAQQAEIQARHGTIEHENGTCALQHIGLWLSALILADNATPVAT
jgi:hypothetical protein